MPPDEFALQQPVPYLRFALLRASGMYGVPAGRLTFQTGNLAEITGLKYRGWRWRSRRLFSLAFSMYRHPTAKLVSRVSAGEYIIIVRRSEKS